MSQLTKELALNAQKCDGWKFGNDILYKLCQDFPKHDTSSQIVGKIWLIGRSYAAAIERRKTGDAGIPEGDDFYFDRVAPFVLESDIDTWIQSIGVKELPNNDNLVRIVDVHWRVTDLFLKISGQEKRSLASKYLHFHRPETFFIYDSRAVSAISKYKEITGRASKSDQRCDGEYRKFYYKCLKLQKYIHDTYDVYLAPRAIDNLLLTR